MLVEPHCLSPRNERPPGRKRTAAPAGIRDGGAKHKEADELQRQPYHGRTPSQAPSPAAPTESAACAPTAGHRDARADALTREQLCARLGIDRTTLWRWIKSGHFTEADAVMGGRAAWSLQAVEQWECREGLTRAQLCARFNITPRALYNWLQSGFFPQPDMKIKGRDAWSPQAVQAWRTEMDDEARQRTAEREFEEQLEEARRAQLAQLRREAAAHAAQLVRPAVIPGNPAALTEADVYDECRWVPGSAAARRQAQRAR